MTLVGEYGTEGDSAETALEELATELPFPSCPYVLSPQQATDPSDRSAQLPES